MRAGWQWRAPRCRPSSPRYHSPHTDSNRYPNRHCHQRCSIRHCYHYYHRRHRQQHRLCQDRRRSTDESRNETVDGRDTNAQVASCRDPRDAACRNCTPAPTADRLVRDAAATTMLRRRHSDERRRSASKATTPRSKSTATIVHRHSPHSISVYYTLLIFFIVMIICTIIKFLTCSFHVDESTQLDIRYSFVVDDERQLNCYYYYYYYYCCYFANCC